MPRGRCNALRARRPGYCLFLPVPPRTKDNSPPLPVVGHCQPCYEKSRRDDRILPTGIVNAVGFECWPSSLFVFTSNLLSSFSVVPAGTLGHQPSSYYCRSSPTGLRPPMSNFQNNDDLARSAKWLYFKRNNTAASTAPAIGPSTGIQAYDQSLSRLFRIGSSACMMRGARSRAGLIA